MSSYGNFFQEQMRDPEVKAEYDALEPKFSIIQAIIDARKESGLTQKELASRTGIAQADISKLERRINSEEKRLTKDTGFKKPDI